MPLAEQLEAQRIKDFDELNYTTTKNAATVGGDGQLPHFDNSL